MPFNFSERQPLQGQPMVGRDAYGYFADEWDSTIARPAVIEWIPITKVKLEYLDGFASSKEYQKACKVLWDGHV